MALSSVVLAALLLIALPALTPASIIPSRRSHHLHQQAPEPLMDSRDAYLTNEDTILDYDDEPPREAAAAAATEPEVSVPCPGCAHRRTESQTSEEELKALRIEYIKQQILDKLRMTAPPNVTAPRPAVLPEPLLRSATARAHEHMAVEHEGTDDFYGKTTEVILFANEAVKCHSSRPAACLKFALRDTLQADQVRSAELWVYKQLAPGYIGRNQTFTVTRLGNPSHRALALRDTVAMEATAVKRGWIKFEVKRAVKQWLNHPHTNHGLEVSCKDCNWGIDDSPVALKADLKPFIVIHTREQQRRRTKREAITCQNGTRQCCLDPLVVDFAAIGWNSWVIEPASFTANFCRGSCLSDNGPYAPRYGHSTIIQLMKSPQFEPCCGPTRVGGLDIIYQEEDGIKESFLPGVIALECGCM